ncbi:MAG TPA: thymidine kinase, partial [Bacilli bacterium]|nr:thymidine kinase [Bacilli bacterium]
MDLQVKDGWIEVISGSMYAGKTEELIRRVKRIEYARKEVIVFKPLIDNRYSSNEVVSHDNGRTKSIDISNPEEIYQHLNGRLPYAV